MKRVTWTHMTRLAVGTLSVIASWPLAVWAQEPGPEEIVVTARKRAESLEDAPVSITAFTSNDVSMRGATDINDLLRSVPNVTVDNNLTIRGIGYNTRNIGIEAGATVYIDGVYTGRIRSIKTSRMYGVSKSCVARKGPCSARTRLPASFRSTPSSRF